MKMGGIEYKGLEGSQLACLSDIRHGDEEGGKTGQHIYAGVARTGQWPAMTSGLITEFSRT